MTDRLSPHYIGATTESLGKVTFEKLIGAELEAIQYPEPNLSDVSQYGMSPDALRDEGYDLPEDEEDPEEALEFAVNHFKQSDQYYEWQDGFVPVSSMLWPCDPLNDVTKLVQALNDQYVSCCFVSGELDEKEYKGFMVTGGNMNLSDHVAIAYIEAGFIPPLEVLEQAVRNTRKQEWKDRFLVALEQASAWYAGDVERMNETLARYRTTEARP